jgi:hypothetical protein
MSGQLANLLQAEVDLNWEVEAKRIGQRGRLVCNMSRPITELLRPLNPIEMLQLLAPSGIIEPVIRVRSPRAAKAA